MDLEVDIYGISMVQHYFKLCFIYQKFCSLGILFDLSY